ncbi:DMT family transporter [Sinisalibacter lacisalsi]|uniref:Multidrug transporter n=1 Tax=Sinisalibacter lacisalsi TaxID=1526570 RepID=A0ABQ1QM93_9RHOB|nr:DMT family transporter [Sinisalibacter lacisalsi]GGD35706.1 multidrug transporter [Sinisalibacter lacisalsi]
MSGAADWITAIEGTPAGHDAALVLALMAALLHALFGALQKGRHDPWLSRGAIDAAYGLIAAPVALFVVPWPDPSLIPFFALVWLVHTTYKLAQGYTYSLGSYTVVYPVVRGTGPLFAVIGAGLVFGERFTPVQWLGVATLLAGIYGLAIYNLRHWQIGRDRLRPALAMAVLTGGFVALYTTVDAWGIRATPDPFTFLAWFFMIDGLVFPVLAAIRWRRMAAPPALAPLALRGIIGAFVAFFSFGAIMLATRLDQVGQAAVLRETSTVFAALIGWLVLGERVGPRRIALMALIALGAVIVEAGG